MANLMDLMIKIGVEDEASAKIPGITQKIGKGISSAAKLGATAIGAVVTAVGAAAGAFVREAANVASYADNIDKMSQKMGMSAEAYQEWDAILQHSGSSIDSMQRGMMTLSSAAEKGSEAFDKIGISQEQVASMSQEELFAATIEGLQGLESGSERAVLAQQLLGTAAKELGPLLNTSAEETEAMRQRVHELGGVMSDEAVKAGAAFQDSLQDMQTAFSGVKNAMMADFLPSMTKVTDGLTEIFSGNFEGGADMISEGIQDIANGLTEALPTLVTLGVQIAETLINSAVENLPGLIETLLPVLINGFVNIVAALVSNIPAIVSAIWSALKAAATQLWPVLEGAFSGIADWFAAKFQAARDAIATAFSGVGDFFKGVWEDITGAFSDAAEIGSKIVSDIISGLSAGWHSLTTWISEAWGKIKSLFTVDVKMPGGGAQHAIGLDYVPYDQYPAMLHRGEAVLTAREADEWRRGQGSGSGGVVNNFTFNGVSQSDLDYIVAYVNRGLA